MFTGSESWAKKFARRHDLKMSGTRVKELSEDDARKFSTDLRHMSSRLKQAGPGYDEIAAVLRQAGDKLVAAQIFASRPAPGDHLRSPPLKRNNTEI